jgi:D-alanyl-D-alanine carboxypeptidase (penicillin-binding protein 5/6)
MKFSQPHAGRKHPENPHFPANCGRQGVALAANLCFHGEHQSTHQKPHGIFSMRLLLTAFFVLILTTPAMAQMETVARQAYIIDFETGQVLFEKNAHEKMPTSSMSKTLTGYMVFDALKNGKITLDQEFPVSEKAWRMQGSKMFVPLGGMIKVEDLIRGMLIQSGNDATIVLAEGISGTEEQFVDAMNTKAQQIGMTESHFMNASGWPDPEHYSTAHDLAVLGRALIHDFPDYYHYDSEKDFTYNNIKQGNRNPLLYKNIGADGIKTGHTDDAGYGLMGSAVRDGRRVIMVLNGMASMEERAQESTRLMEWALASFTNKSILSSGMKVADAPVIMGVEKSVPLIVNQDMKITMPRGASANVRAEAVFKAPLEAPVTEGQEVGIVRITIPNQQPIEVPVLAAKSIPRLGFFPATMEKGRRLIMGDGVSRGATAQ